MKVHAVTLQEALTHSLPLIKVEVRIFVENVSGAWIDYNLSLMNYYVAVN